MSVILAGALILALERELFVVTRFSSDTLHGRRQSRQEEGDSVSSGSLMPWRGYGSTHLRRRDTVY